MTDFVSALEGRRLFAATATLSGSTLTVTGTSTADAITLSKSGTTLSVKLNGTTKSFAAASVKLIAVNLGGGNDALTSSDGVTSSMKIDGGTGNDTLRAGGGADTLAGGDGNDKLVAGGGRDVLAGGGGTDTADYSIYASAVKISLNGKADDGKTGEGDNVAVDVENVSGGSGADTITGSSAANVIYGNGGGDDICGSDWLSPTYSGASRFAPDTLYGNSGDDYLSAGGNRSVVYGGEGGDNLSDDDANTDFTAVTLYGEGGPDEFYTRGANVYADGGVGDDSFLLQSTGARAYGRDGNDGLTTYYNATLDGGSGTNYYNARGYSTINARNGQADYIDLNRDDNHVTINRDAIDTIHYYIDDTHE